jgi:hypothetical protein
MIAIDGLDANRQANFLCGFPSFVGGGNIATLWHRNTTVGEQTLGEVFVFGKTLGNGAGLVSFGGPNAALVGAITELNQIAVVETNGGNIAIGCSVDNASGAGPYAKAIDHLGEIGNDLIDWVGAVFDGCHDQVASGLKGSAADRFIAGANDHFVNASRACFSGFAETRLHAGSVLQLKGYVLHDVTWPSALGEPLQKATSLANAATVLYEPGKHFLESLVKTGQGVGGEVFQIANVDPSF